MHPTYYLCLPSCLFLSRFPINPACTSELRSTYCTCSAHHTFALVKKSTNYQDLHYAVVCSLQQRPVGQGLLIHEVSRSHTTTHHSREDSSGRVISSLQSPLPDNTQHSQQTDRHAPGGIRTHNFSR